MNVTLEDLPPPPKDRSGWPWTDASPQLPQARPDGSEWPRITIVTPSYNQGQYIEETIRSILLQGYPDLEYFVMDGGSTDSSVEIIKRYSPWIKYWESAPDQGQAHAINKGLSRATGVIFNWLNSDDFLARGALFEVANAYKSNAIVAGGCVHIWPDHSEVNWSSGLDLISLIDPSLESSFQQPAQWMDTEILRKQNGVDQCLHFCFDLKAMISASSAKVEFIYIEKVLAFFRRHCEAKTSASSRGFIIDRLGIWDELKGHPEELVQTSAARAAQIDEVNLYYQDFLTLTLRGQVFHYIRFGLRRPSFFFDRYALGAIRRRLFGGSGE